MYAIELINGLQNGKILTADEFVTLIENRAEIEEYAAEKAKTAAIARFGNGIYVRGLIEFTNYCKNDCHYCGIRAGNGNCERYRLSKDEILSCCELGYKLDFRTFVLQGGEDNFYDDTLMCEIIRDIKAAFNDCAVTLSIGEKSRETYRKYYEAGADRYLLRHETADNEHYSKLHPKSMSPENRKRCLRDLKEIGFQTGAGFMVGSPFQTTYNIAEDLMFIQNLRPEMVGIGPFIAHKDTIFANCDNPNGLELTLFLVSLVRLMLPDALIPATTAVGTLDVNGREKAILRGANVLMPNLSPVASRRKYMLYDGKICTGDEAAECAACLKRRVNAIGYDLLVDRGDFAQKV